MADLGYKEIYDRDFFDGMDSEPSEIPDFTGLKPNNEYGASDFQYFSPFNFENVSIDGEFSRNREEAQQYEAEMSTRYSDAAGDMNCMDRLDQAQLKVQCSNYNNKLETENQRLEALSTVFASASSSVAMKGKTYNGLIKQCEVYCLIIRCLELANLFDIHDNNLLAARLGEDFLDGSVILHGIEYSWMQYESECRASDHCTEKADSTDDLVIKESYRSEARHHKNLANNYYEEWKEYRRLKQEFEDIRDYSTNFYTNSTDFRAKAQVGMKLIAYDFVDGNYTIPSSVSTWCNGIEKLEEKVLMEYAQQWKNEDGSWNMEVLDEMISRDDDSLTELDYMAMCQVVDSEGFLEEHMEEFMSSGMVGEFIPYDDTTTYDGTWTYHWSQSYQKFVVAYAAHLNSTLAAREQETLAGLPAGADDDTIFKAKNDAREACNAQYERYNILYAGAMMFEDKTVEGTAYKGVTFGGTKFDSDTFDMQDYGHKRLEIKIEKKGDYYSVSGDIYHVDDQQIVHTKYHNSYRAYGYSWAINKQIHEYINDLGKSGEKISDEEVNISMAETAGITALGFAPGIGTYVTLGSAALSMLDCRSAADEHNQLIGALSNVHKYNDLEAIYDELNVSGSMVISEDGNAILTSVYMGKDTVTEHLAKYNKKNHTPFVFNYDTVLFDLQNDKDGTWTEELKEFLNFADKINYLGDN